MDRQDLVAAAARNNAQWCDAVCRAHGLSTSFNNDAWICFESAPPFYPRLVSFTDDADRLRRLIEAHRHRSASVWGAKDSFDVLTDDDAHRTPLFSAFWYARPPAASPEPQANATVVGSTGGLRRWIEAWGETPAGTTVLPAKLLDEPGVTFVHDGSFRAGLAAMRSRDEAIIGVTNFFGAAAVRNACLAGLAHRNPDCTLVGYGPKSEVDSLAPLGFDPVAPLTVWLVRDHDAPNR